MSTEVERIVVDRFEGRTVVLISDDMTSIEVDRSLLPDGARPGAVLRVSRDGQGGLLWSGATVDEQATADRLSEAEELLAELRDRDPGGDIVL